MISLSRIVSVYDRSLYESEGEFNEVEAFAVGGSAGRGEMDVLSDIDIFLLVSAKDLPEFLERKMRPLAGRLGEPALFRGPVFVQGFGYSFTIAYVDGLSIVQFNVADRAILKPSVMQGQKKLVLFDRDGYFSQTILDSHDEVLDFGLGARQAFTFCCLRVLAVRKDLKRGDLWFAIRHLGEVREQLFVLVRALECSSPPGLSFQASSKCFERDHEKEANRFRQSLCEYTPQSVNSALIFCLDTAIELGLKICERIGSITERDLRVALEVRKFLEVE